MGREEQGRETPLPTTARKIKKIDEYIDTDSSRTHTHTQTHTHIYIYTHTHTRASRFRKSYATITAPVNADF